MEATLSMGHRCDAAAPIASSLKTKSAASPHLHLRSVRARAFGSSLGSSPRAAAARVDDCYRLTAGSLQQRWTPDPGTA